MGDAGNTWGVRARKVLPDDLTEAYDYLMARRRVERPETRPSWPHRWRRRFVQAVVSQAVSVMDTPEGFRPATAVLVLHPPPPEATTGFRRRWRGRPDAADYTDPGLMLNIRKRAYRLLAEVAEGQGHQPPGSLAIVFQTFGSDDTEGEARSGIRGRIDRWWGFGLRAEVGPAADLATVGSLDPVARRVRSATGGTRPLEVDQLRPIRRLTESELGSGVDPELAALGREDDDLAEREQRALAMLDELRSALIPSPGDEGDITRVEAILGALRARRARVAQEVAARSMFALEVEAWGDDDLRVRGLGLRLTKVRKTRPGRAWADAMGRLGARVRVDPDTAFRLGHQVWDTLPLVER